MTETQNKEIELEVTDNAIKCYLSLTAKMLDLCEFLEDIRYFFTHNLYRFNGSEFNVTYEHIIPFDLDENIEIYFEVKGSKITVKSFIRGKR